MKDINLRKIFLNTIVPGGRLRTREVDIGGVPLGGRHPVRLQSMATSPTLDTLACVAEAERIIRAGAEYLRFTARTVAEAENLANIRDALRRRGYRTPLVADVHFQPAIAETAARIVEKVRINPGNFVRIPPLPEELSPGERAARVEEAIRERLVPLLHLCRQHGTALRIGVNHGSLAPRIVEEWGDTPRGMVVSAMEYLRICRAEGFHEVVLSMKSSNARVMVQAYRLLVATMAAEGELYPLHLGITEAGEGEEGRIRSAVGIGTLLAEGIGDTVRISLTEPSENEIPAARKLVHHVTPAVPEPAGKLYAGAFDPFTYHPPALAGIPGLSREPVVVTEAPAPATTPPADLTAAGDNLLITDEGKKITCLTVDTAMTERPSPEEAKVVVVEVAGEEGSNTFRRLVTALREEGVQLPMILRKKYILSDREAFILAAAADTGPLFLDGLAQGLWLTWERPGVGAGDEERRAAVETAFAILQAARVRTTRTEYISCPSCGRTLFDIQEVTARIRARTSHLTGVRIAIMGCIVNGPGEMADADYGYVGAGPGRITLYHHKEVVKKNIPAEQAVDELIRLIKEKGDWKEKQS